MDGTDDGGVEPLMEGPEYLKFAYAFLPSLTCELGLRPEDADDIAQIGYEKLQKQYHRAPASFRTKDDQRAWAYTVMRNDCFSLVQRKMLDEKLKQRAQEEGTPSHPAPDEGVSQKDEQLADELLTGQPAMILVSALPDSEPELEIILAFYFPLDSVAAELRRWKSEDKRPAPSIYKSLLACYVAAARDVTALQNHYRNYGFKTYADLVAKCGKSWREVREICIAYDRRVSDAIAGLNQA